MHKKFQFFSEAAGLTGKVVVKWRPTVPRQRRQQAAGSAERGQPRCNRCAPARAARGKAGGAGVLHFHALGVPGVTASVKTQRCPCVTSLGLVYL